MASHQTIQTHIEGNEGYINAIETTYIQTADQKKNIYK